MMRAGRAVRVALWGAVALGCLCGGTARAQTITFPAGPLTLQDAVALALTNNPDVRAASERIAIAEAQVGEATAAFYPKVSTSLSYTRTDQPAQAFSMIISQRRLSFEGGASAFNDPPATQNVRPEIGGVLSLFRGGEDYYRRAAAQQGVVAAQWEQAAVRNALTDAVTAAYYALCAAPEQVAASQASIAAVSSATDQTRARVESGAALKADLLSLEVRLAAARESDVQARNAVALARTGLRVLLGLPAETVVEVTTAPSSALATPPATLSEAHRDALRRRPEVSAAAHLLTMREHELRMERAAYYPRVNALGVYGQDAENLELSRTRDNWTFGATAELELFGGFRTRERVRSAEHRLAEAREIERRTRLDVERDVETAFLTAEESRQRARVADAAVPAAEEALRLVEAQYQAGTTTVTRYLEAEVARTGARSHAIAARYTAQRADAALCRAVGLFAEAPPP